MKSAKIKEESLQGKKIHEWTDFFSSLFSASNKIPTHQHHRHPQLLISQVANVPFP